MLAFFTLMIGPVARAGDEAPPPATGVTVKQVAGARIVEALLPGPALDSAVGNGGVAVLIAGEDDKARALYRFDPSGDGSLVEIARDLPPELDAVDLLDGRLIAGEPGRLYSLGRLDDPATGREPRLLLEAPDLDLEVMSRRGWLTADRAFVLRPRLGRIDAYSWHGHDAPEPIEIELPVRARRVRTGLVLSSPPVHLLERDGEPPLLAIGPEAQGKRRLLTTLVDPDNPGNPSDHGDSVDAEPGGGGDGEAWTQFSANERVAQSWYLDVDGRPMLAVAALSADKLGIFEKKKLRVFPLRTDRTRAGSPPALAIDTATRNWYDLGVQVADLDGDGRDDLVVIQPDGLGAKKLVVEAYRGKGNGGFFLTPRRSVVVAPDAAWTYGSDFDGDGLADLVAACGGRVLVFRGSSKKKLVIDKTPYRSFEATDLGDVPDPTVEIHVGDDEGGSDESGSDEDSDSDSDAPSLGRPWAIDLDGDGRSEILLVGNAGGRAVLRVISLR